MSECQNCGMRDDDWFLCRRPECPNKAPTVPPKTLRDEFAMAALTGIITRSSRYTPDEEMIAEAYGTADVAMTFRASLSRQEG